MKRKILAITLSIALLTTLFVLAVPTSAGNKYFPVSITTTFVSWVGGVSNTYGDPTSLKLPYPADGPKETREIPYTVSEWTPITSNILVEADFGPEIGTLEGTGTTSVYSYFNYATNKGTGYRTMEIEFIDGSTAIFQGVGGKFTAVHWSYASDSTRPYSTKTEGFGTLVMVHGTGELAGLEVICDVFKDTNNSIHMNGKGRSWESN